jgi:ankyrin repeat domain-containing protein 50
MAEPLSLIASLIAVVQISGELVSICYHYHSSASKAAKSVLRLSAEAKDLRNIVESLLDVINTSASVQAQLKATAILASKDGMLETTLLELEELQGRLSPASGWRAAGKILKWPLTEPELNKSLDRINRLKSSLLVATTTDQLWVTDPASIAVAPQLTGTGNCRFVWQQLCRMLLRLWVI